MPENKQVMLKHLLFCFLIVNTLTVAFAQQNQTEEDALAIQYFQEKDFEKAAILFEKLFEKSQSKEHFNYYIKSLVALQAYKKAEKEARKYYKKHFTDLTILVTIGNIQKADNDTKGATKAYKEAIENITPNKFQILQLSEAFSLANEPDYAIECLEKGKQLLPTDKSIRFRLADLYAATKQNDKMLAEYIELLEQDPESETGVKNSLNNFLAKDENNEQYTLIKKELLKQTQKNKQNLAFNNLLIWLMVQKKDYEGAFLQSQALDKRRNEGGARLINLAEQALMDNQYDMAVKCYQYVIDLGTTSAFYYTARTNLLKTLYQKIVVANQYTTNEPAELVKAYQTTIAEFKQQDNTLLIIELAHIQAFYTQQIQEAVDLLENTIKNNRSTSINIAKCKLELADILVLQNDLWESALLYAQVEKSFKEDPLGQEAKFRNAKLSFYKGEFEWARAQLDVLKTATSKLIANDALYLSALIIKNTNEDTTYAALTQYAKADLQLFQNKPTEALKTIDYLITTFPQHSIIDDALYKKAKIYLKQNNYQLAAQQLKYIIENYPKSIIIDQIIFELAELYEVKINDKEMAKKYYEQLITQHTGSIYIVQAREKYRKLRGDKTF